MLLKGRRSVMGVCRCGVLVDLSLVLFLVILGIIFVQRHIVTKSDLDEEPDAELDLPQGRDNPSVVRKMSQKNSSQNFFEPVTNVIVYGGEKRVIQIDERIQGLRDVRSRDCKVRTYRVKDKVTIVVVFNDYQFYDLKQTIGSVLFQTDLELIHEILVIDDGSTLTYIIDDANAYFRSLPKTRLLRSRSREMIGIARARAMAMAEVQSGIVAFLDSNVVVNHRWLEPLLESLRRTPTSIVVPHYDRIRDPVSYEYETTNDQLVAAVSWNLSIRMRNRTATKPAVERSGESVGELDEFDSPAVRGNAFVVRKDFFEEIGGYDDALDNLGGGEHLELSLRVWMCGGTIRVVRCSRVGVLNLHDPVKVSAARNVVRIADLWFGTRKEVVIRTAGFLDKAKKDGVSPSLSPPARRTTFFDSSGECHDMDWYLESVATDMAKPTADSVKFGVLRVKTGRCARLLRNTNRVALEECKPEHFNNNPPDMVFELTKSGRLMVLGRCLTTEDNAYVLAEECRVGESKQEWKYRNGELVSVWCKYCAMHVTDPDNKNSEADRQIAMAQDCGTDTSTGALFKSWEFVAL